MHIVPIHPDTAGEIIVEESQDGKTIDDTIYIDLLNFINSDE